MILSGILFFAGSLTLGVWLLTHDVPLAPILAGLCMAYAILIRPVAH